MDERISNLKGKKNMEKKINKEIEIPKLPPPSKNKNNEQTNKNSQPANQTNRKSTSERIK